MSGVLVSVVIGGLVLLALRDYAAVKHAGHVEYRAFEDRDDTWQGAKKFTATEHVKFKQRWGSTVTRACFGR